MRKIFKKIITISLCFVSVFASVFATSCGKEGESDQGKQPKFVGTHDVKITITDDYLVKNGTTKYELVLPDGVLPEELKVAKQEFIYFFQKATGIAIPSRTDKDLTFAEDKTYISLGNTSLYENVVQADETKAVPYETYSTGYQIFNKGKSIFLVGGNDLGTAYSVYKFMELTFNYQSYANNCFVIDEGVKNKWLYSYDIKDIPDIKYVSTNSYGVFKNANTYDERMFKYRMRAAVSNNERTFWLYSTKDPTYAKAAAQGAHTALTLVPITEFRKAHPKWFSDRSDGSKEKSQLCYTAHGDETEYAALLQQTADSITHSLKRKPASTDTYQVAVNVGDEDNSNHCDCVACKEIMERCGARSAVEILFLNDLIPLIEEWMSKPENADYKRENLKYSFLVYNETEPAPATYNSKTKKYELNGGLVINEKITPILCCATYMDFRSSLYSENNAGQLPVFDAWNDICDKFAFWTYSTAFRSLSFFSDTFNCYNNDMYERLAQFDSWFLYNESQGSVKGALTGFHQLKLYLESKLAWDCNLNQEELINNYFDAMYKDVAPLMKEIYYSERVIADKAAVELDLYKTEQILTNVSVARAYDLATLLQLLEKYEVAYSEVEKYKEVDLELYNALHFHISQEWVSPAVMVIQMFFDKLTIEDATDLLNDFKAVYQETQISNVITGGTATTDKWIAEKEEELNKR